MYTIHVNMYGIKLKTLVESHNHMFDGLISCNVEYLSLLLTLKVRSINFYVFGCGSSSFTGICRGTLQKTKTEI